MTSDTDALIRACCGLRHDGAMCPDGLVMCQLCFGRFPPAAMHVDANATAWDVCRECAAAEMDARRAAAPREVTP